MAKNLVLKAEVREHTGSKFAERIRRDGRIPAIVYGHKLEPVAVSLDAHSFVEGLHHGHRVVEVEVGRKKETMVVKDLQYDHLGKNVIHADLLRVKGGERVRVNVPVELKGTAAGTHEGGIVEEHADRVEIECKVDDIPETIVVWIKDVHVGDNVHAGQIEMPDGVRLVSDPEMLVVACHMVAAAKSTEEIEAETAVSPEVIGEVEKEDEGDKDSGG